MPFLMGTIPHVKRLADAFRKAGRPVVYVAHVLKPDYSDAQFPYWRLPPPPSDNSTFVVEGTWGAQIVDDLITPRRGTFGRKERLRRLREHAARHDFPQHGRDHLRSIRGDHCACVSTTMRGGVEHNYRMILVRDAVAEVNRDTHEAELETMDRLFADVKTTDEVVAMLAGTTATR